MIRENRKYNNRAFIFSFLIGCLTISSQSIYVSKTGNDESNTGAESSPFLTISKAASVAEAGTTVFIRAGVYEETLTPINSGVAGNPIVFRSYPGEKVIISALQKLDNWTNDSGSIYKTTIDFLSLGQKNFVLNKATAMDLARWPNNTDGLPFTINSTRNTGGSGPDVIQNAYLESSEIPNFDWTGGAVFFYGDRPGAGWLAWKAFITSSSNGRVTFDLDKNPSWIRRVHPPQDLGDYYLEGIKEVLDYENEWWFNAATNELFVQLPGGVQPLDGQISMRKRLKTIDLDNKSFIEIRELAVLGGSISITGNANDNLLFGVSSFYGNHTQGISSSFSANEQSLKITGNRNIIEKCEIAFGAAAGVRNSGEFTVIKNCYIHDFNYLGSYDAPLSTRDGDDVKVIGNTIFNGGRDAVIFSGQRLEFAYNDVSKSNLIADDCGLFYSTEGPRDTEIHHNWFHDAYSRGNLSKAAGIYLDTNPSAYSVHHNVIWNTEWAGIQMNWDAKDIDIFNNTFLNNSDEMDAWHLDGTAFNNVKTWNNLGFKGSWEPQSDKQNNLVVGPATFVDSQKGNFALQANTSPIDAGIEILEITTGYVGSNPDVGAYEFGKENWVAGIDWNPFEGPTGSGCYDVPGEKCGAEFFEDTDKDGIVNSDDTCPNTPEGAVVNRKGCLIFPVGSDNFSVLARSEKCVGKNNGSINITAKFDKKYIAKITENGLSKPFSQSTSFENLAVGTYNLCITIEDFPDFEQCFTVVIKPLEKLEVIPSVDAKNHTVTLKLFGGDTYHIVHNKSKRVTSAKEVTLQLEAGENLLEVKTDKVCQGVFQKSFSSSSDLLLYPNPVLDVLHFALPTETENQEVIWEIYSLQGKLIQTSNSGLSTRDLHTSSLQSGSYILKIITPKKIYHKHIIKI